MRTLLAGIAHWGGMTRLLRFVRRNSIAIVMMHGVMDEGVPSSWTPLRPQLSRRRLRTMMEALSRGYRFVSLERAVDMLAGRVPLTPCSVVLTFDDGYRNQIKHALPVLEEYGAPATIFLATAHVAQRKPFWFDRLDYALQHARLSGREFMAGNEMIRFPSDRREDVCAAFKRMRDAAKRADRPDELMVREMESLADQLEQESGHRLADIFETDDWSSVLDWKEAKIAADHPLVTFGSHTVDHTRLGLSSDEDVRRQARLSKDAIQEHIGRACSCFCFPSGSFSLRSLAILQEVGYRAAVTTLEGLNSRAANPFALRRISLPGSEHRSEILWHLTQPSQVKAALRGGRGEGTAECIVGD
jgi:peptidoglycan/xylan/chitin deacetylase (PgdA/CDA1 family)